MVLYHGSDKIVEKPKYGYGKDTNDYGIGFYLTEDLEIAKEWASGDDRKEGYVNKYKIDESKLNILDLDQVEDKVLKWIALLVNYRNVKLKNPIGIRGREFLIKNYLIDVDKYDLIRGYRADDCYFMFARSFLNNEISIEQLGKALLLGKLGDQYVLKSKKAFNNIKFIDYEKIDLKEYYNKRIARNRMAAEEYDKVISKINKKEKYLSDILKEYEN